MTTLTCIEGHDNPSSARFCTICGTNVFQIRPPRLVQPTLCDGGHHAPPGAAFCPACGSQNFVAPKGVWTRGTQHVSLAAVAALLLAPLPGGLFVLSPLSYVRNAWWLIALTVSLAVLGMTQSYQRPVRGTIASILAIVASVINVVLYVFVLVIVLFFAALRRSHLNF